MNKPVVMEWVASPVGQDILELTGNLLYVPTKNKFLVMRKIGATKAAFSFEEDPIHLKNEHLTALFLDAILILFNDDDGYAGNKIEFYSGTNGINAFGLKSENHTYFASFIMAGEKDNRVAAMTFWRESLAT
ncbi:hypothetical protein [Ralstonia pseudosolanacearum]